MRQMATGFVQALVEIAKRKNIPQAELVSLVKDALSVAYRRRYGVPVEIEVEVDWKKGEALVFLCKSVVETLTNPHTEVALEDARVTDPDAVVGDIFMDQIEPEELGRIAAQTAKQVILQKVREIERDQVFEQFNQKVHQVITGEIQRRDDRGNIFVTVDSTEAVLPRREQVETERYRFAERMRFLVLEARQDARSAQVILSRTHPDLVRRLLELEIPEIAENVVEIVTIARRPGLRAKVAVRSRDPRVDAVGACIGSRGARASAVSSELRGERVEIIRWSASPTEFLENALSPARVQSMALDDGTHSARIIVPDDQLSLAIGRAGHNVRLAVKLTGWNIDLLSASQAASGEAGHLFETAAEEQPATPEAGEPRPAGQTAAPQEH
jgi:N utilization substance protein A